MQDNKECVMGSDSVGCAIVCAHAGSSLSSFRLTGTASTAVPSACCRQRLGRVALAQAGSSSSCSSTAKGSLTGM